jgi:hypothetical protein
MNEKKPLIITIVVLVIILILGGVGVYFLEYDYLAQLKDQLAQEQMKVEEAEKKKARIPGLLAAIEDLKRQEREKIVRIPDLGRAEYDVFAVLLDGLRKQSGVNVSRGGWMTPQPQSRGGIRVPSTIHKVEYNISADGSFYQLLRYLNLLEQQKRFISIESLSFARGAEPVAAPGRTPMQTRQQAKREMKLTLASYTYRPSNAQTGLMPAKPAEERSGKSTDLPD